MERDSADPTGWVRLPIARVQPGGAMKNTQLARRCAHSLAVLLMLSGAGPVGIAQSHDHSSPAAGSKPNPREGELVKAVREATAKYRDSSAATGDGYQLQFGCVSGGDFGAMGLHYVNFALVGDGEVDVASPEIVLYEPLSDGSVRITGADYLVLAADWDEKHMGPPQLRGQLFHLFESPNRFGLPPFYTLHVWAWKANPVGTFTNWNPAVSCDAFSPTETN
jgi:hypothetical protein